MGLPADLLKSLYRYLILTRSVENRIATICQSQNPVDPLIIGKGYLSTGQEAISVASAMTLRNGDWLAVGHRDMGAHLVRGVTAHQIFSQYFCRENSFTQGRDSNVHFGCAEKNIAGFVSHMGASCSVALGLAAAMKYRGHNNFVLTTFGDGASSQGIVHESLNYAAVFKLPIIFVINNNQYAISTGAGEQYAVKNLADRASGYGMPGFVVDGNDSVAIYNQAMMARDYALSGKGPVMLECKTMRLCGHGTHDSATYVPKKDLAYWQSRDPILLMKNYLLEHAIFNEADDEQLINEVNIEVEAAWQLAASQLRPVAESLLTGVYTEDKLDGPNDLWSSDSSGLKLGNAGR